MQYADIAAYYCCEKEEVFPDAGTGTAPESCPYYFGKRPGSGFRRSSSSRFHCYLAYASASSDQKAPRSMRHVECLERWVKLFLLILIFILLMQVHEEEKEANL